MSKNKKQYWAVMSDRAGEGTIFDNKEDANYALTGRQTTFGVSTLADEFRNLFGDYDDLRMIEIELD